MSDTNNHWEHVKTVTEGELFTINGLNIWDHEWKDTGERIKIKDPLHAQEFTLSIYEITHDHIKAQFATGEFSNNVWGIYLKKD